MYEEAIVLLIRINNAQVEFVKRVKNLLVNSFMLLFFGREGGFGIAFLYLLSEINFPLEIGY